MVKTKLKMKNKAQKRPVKSGSLFYHSENIDVTYYRGVKRDFTYNLFLMWLVTPSFARGDLVTQKDFSERYSVTQKTLSKWKKKSIQKGNPYLEEMRKIVMYNLPDVLGAIKLEAMKGSVKHAKLFLEYVDLL